MTQITRDLIDTLKATVGDGGYLDTDTDMAPFLTDWRGTFVGRTPIIVRPASTEALARVVSLCAGAGVAIVPQGGNTGMMGGSVPSPDGDQILVSLARMNRIRAVDPLNYTMTVEAGCILADIQRAAAEADRLFPLSLAAEGSAQIGGNLSTNAGGTAVLRYGNARDLVLGLEVVLPDGRIWHGLRALRKDNTGYDLKQYFLGAEGTLGIIAAAVLKLYPRPADTCTAMVAVRDPQAAIRLLAAARGATGDGVTTFEYMHRQCLDLVFDHVPGCIDPFTAAHEHYALVELASGGAGGGLTETFEGVLAAAFEEGAVHDAVIAASSAQAEQLWRLRESIPEANTKTGACIRHDVSVAVARVPEFLERGTALCRAAVPGVSVTPFGHMGDGNIHFNLVPGEPGSRAALLENKDAVTRAIHDLVMAMDGSFSAEHGIGALKRTDLVRYRSAVELDLMRSIKRALDPRGIMNPGKVL